MLRNSVMHSFFVMSRLHMLQSKSGTHLTLSLRLHVVLLVTARCMSCAAVGRDDSFDSLARHDTTTLQRAVMSPVQMPRLQQQQQQQQQLSRQAPDSNVTRQIEIHCIKTNQPNMLYFDVIFAARIAIAQRRWYVFVGVHLCMFLFCAITVELFEVSSWNFNGARHGQNLG